MGIRGEPSTPDDPALGRVWTAILQQIDVPGSESAFVSVANLARGSLHHHPWSIGGGGAAELKELLDERGTRTLSESVESIGFMAITGEDDAFLIESAVAARRGLPARPFITGDSLRDWRATWGSHVLFPYSGTELGSVEGEELEAVEDQLWTMRGYVRARSMFGKTAEEHGGQWFSYMQLTKPRASAGLSIAFAEVATHNHFVLDRGGKVFKQTAPVITLPASATEDDHLALLAVLNSSTAQFWLAQTCHNKGGGGIGGGIASESWEQFLVYRAGSLEGLPLPEQFDLCRAAGATLDALALRLSEISDSERLSRSGDLAKRQSEITEMMISAQEELDWLTYELYGLTNSLPPAAAPPPLRLGQRPFEIVLARRLRTGGAHSRWFERHGSTPITELPTEWPDDYKRLVERRIGLIERDRYIGLIEQPEYKRRWNTEPLDERLRRTARSQLLDRLELPEYWPTVRVTSVAHLADTARQDRQFMQVAEVYTGHADFDVHNLVDELVRDEAVPHLPVLRYTESGMRKRAQWERTWDLQRREDEIDGHVDEVEARKLKAELVGESPVPPKYTSSDFKSGSYWRLRGKLDIPKERFVSYPGCERAADGSLAVGWAGWHDAQQARSLGDYYMKIKDEEGSASPKLLPLLAGLLDLLPWVRQWHPGPDPEFGVDLAETYESFVDTEARALGTTVEALKTWTPPQSARRPRRSRRES